MRLPSSQLRRSPKKLSHHILNWYSSSARGTSEETEVRIGEFQGCWVISGAYYYGLIRVLLCIHRIYRSNSSSISLQLSLYYHLRITHSFVITSANPHNLDSLWLPLSSKAILTRLSTRYSIVSQSLIRWCYIFCILCWNILAFPLETNAHMSALSHEYIANDKRVVERGVKLSPPHPPLEVHNKIASSRVDGWS
jgi:hypothetical protein